MCLSSNKSNVATSKDSTECVNHTLCTIKSVLIEAPILHAGLQPQNSQNSGSSHNQIRPLHIFIQ